LVSRGDELVDFAVIEERRDQPSPPIIQMSFPGIAWMRFANAGIGTVTSSTGGSVKFGG